MTELHNRIKRIENAVLIIGNKIMGKGTWEFVEENTISAIANYNCTPNSFRIDDDIPSEKIFKKWAKVLYKYRYNMDKYLLYVTPGKVDDAKKAVEKSNYFEIVEEVYSFYVSKYGNGYTTYLPLANESFGRFHKLTIKLSPHIKTKFALIYELELISIGILYSILIQLTIGLINNYS